MIRREGTSLGSALRVVGAPPDATEHSLVVMVCDAHWAGGRGERTRSAWETRRGALGHCSVYPSHGAGVVPLESKLPPAIQLDTAHLI